MKVLITFVLAGVAASAQPALAPPQLGFVQDSANSFRAVRGIAGNFILGDSAADGIVAAAYSGSFGWWKNDSSVAVTDRRGSVVASQDAPAGPAMFAFAGNGDPALAYFPANNLLLLWNGGGFQLVSFDWSAFPSSAVRSLALPDPSHATFLIQRDDGLWAVRFLLETGEPDSQAALAGINAPALMLAGGDIVATEAQGIFVRRADGSEVHFAAPLPADFSLQQMGDGWIQLRDAAGCAQFALRVTPGKEGFFALPEVDQ